MRTNTQDNQRKNKDAMGAMTTRRKKSGQSTTKSEESEGKKVERAANEDGDAAGVEVGIREKKTNQLCSWKMQGSNGKKNRYNG